MFADKTCYRVHHVRNPYKVTIYFPGRKLKHEAEKNYPGEFPFSEDGDKISR